MISILLASIIVLGGIATVYYFSSQERLGQALANQLNVPFLSVNGVAGFFGSQGFSASSTLCAIASPAATSTLIFASAQITSATSVDSFIDIAKSSTAFATTTLLGTTFEWDANAKSDLGGTIVASTSPTGNAIIFPPRNWLVIKGMAKNLQADDGTGVPALGVNGTCKAVWVTN